MFIIVTVEDKLSTVPQEFDKRPLDVLTAKIEMKYSNKVLVNGGLCICLYDFLEIGDAYVYPGSEGCAIQQVKFRLVVFKPFIGEVLVGKISKSDSSGLKVSMDFFDDIFIPASLLMIPNEFDYATQEWIWKYEQEEGDPNDAFRLQLGDEIRFKVKMVKFTSLNMSVKGVTATTHASEAESGSATTGGGASAPAAPLRLRQRSSSFGVAPDEELPSAMQIVGFVNDFGLGSPTWW